MIIFGTFRSQRLTVDLRELSIGDAMELCARPPHLHESAISSFLQKVVVKPDRVGQGQVTDTRLWTVQERGAVAAHYLGHISNDSNFKIGESAHYIDYLMADKMAVSVIDMGEIAEDSWFLHPLLGYQAESIERLIDMERIAKGRNGWILGAMAFQLQRSEEIERQFAADSKLPELALHDLNDYELDEWLFKRVSVLKGLPESVFADMLAAYLHASKQAEHLLRVAFADDGIVYVAEVPGLPSARFPVPDLLSEGTARFLGLFAQPVDEPDPVQPPAV